MTEEMWFSWLPSPQHPDWNGDHPVSHKWVQLPISPGLKWSGSEADYSSLSSVKAKNGGAIPPRTHIYLWCDILLIKYREKFTFLPLQRLSK
jgi:hypothetical protein